MEMNMDLFNSWLVNKYIAHRGLHNETFAENSIGAFKNAIENNYAIELDVQQIADGTVVVFHDATLQRVTGQDGYLKNIASEKDLCKYFLEGTKEHIPTFKEVLKVIGGATPILIEIKNTGKVGELEDKVIELLRNYKGEFAIESFNPYVLSYFKTHAPEFVRGQLSCYFRGEKLSFIKKYLLKRLALNRVAEPNFIAYNVDDLPNRYVSKYKNLPLIGWTVRSQEQYLDVVKHCDNVIFEDFIPKI